jgi:methyltransferase (TIGR00027 family)
MDRSLIAGANAWFRAKETTRDDRLLEDRFAIHLAERDARIQAVRFGRFVVPPLARQIDQLQAAHCVRHAAIDRLVLDAVRDGYRIVIVGAGYDMRASRFDLDLVEVDHPATQRRKIERLKNVPHRTVERLAIDLSIDDLPQFSGKTCFVLEGFLHYLSPARFDALLAAMRGDNRVIASYIRTEMYLRADSIFIQLIKLVREIPKLHFTPDALALRLSTHGFSRYRNYALQEQLDLVPVARGRMIDLSQDIAVAER